MASVSTEWKLPCPSWSLLKLAKGHEVALSPTRSRITCSTYLADKLTLRRDGDSPGESGSEKLELSRCSFISVEKDPVY